ncbi:MAG TPA: DNA gyrase subunit A [Chloroflexi bacterium]|nr:DNA gyrase subunit A [Chloroflexota bacterium]
MTIGNVISVDINDEMRSAYLDYAMSVIVARALPDARDGLKPVQRRILYAMHDMGLRANSSYKKSARIVGEVLGKYHPHGDQAVYEAMARMAQDFSMRYPLVDGQGNFGSIDGDSPAAMRYTEARLSRIAEEMLVNIDKDTVDFIDNFDGSLQEPVVLPARMPNLLVNGASGIAVGMATNIPPHNLGEIVAAMTYLIDHYDALDDVGVDDLLQFVKGPDFPTGGIIVGTEGIRQAYTNGRGRIVVRARADIEEMKGGRHRIVITQIPYQVNKSALIARIAQLVREGHIDAISDLRDESDRRGMSIVIELKRNAQPHKVLNQLYKHTPLQSTFSVQLLALVNGEPRLLSLKRAMQVYIEHRREVIRRRSEYELAKARKRAHILEGLLLALAHLDDIIATIRASDDADQARERLMRRFRLTEVQAQAILDMPLRRLAALERQKIEDEYRQIKERIAYLEDLLAHPKKILAVIKADLEEVAEKYGDERRTLIARDARADIREEDLVADVPVLITLTQRGYIKRMPTSAFRAQGRGGRGVAGHTTKEDDEVVLLIPARTLHTVLFFSDRGKVYAAKAYQIPEARRTGKGVAIINLLHMEPGERVTAAVAVPDFAQAEYCFMATRQGVVKRVALQEFAAVRPSGLIAISLREGDALEWVRLTHGDDDILLVTARGQALRFREDEVRPMGRQAAGVTGIRLKPGDRVVSMDVVEPGGFLAVVTEKGYGKRTPLDEYSRKHRATQGIRTLAAGATDKVGPIVAARVVQESDHLTLISSGGIVLRTRVAEISVMGRAARGVRLMRLQPDDSVASVARLPRQA